jgi:methylated-DNA-[protein]-cysteine S-methyltransferase
MAKLSKSEDTMDDTVRTVTLSSPLGDLLLTVRDGALAQIDLTEATPGRGGIDAPASSAVEKSGRIDALAEACRQLEAYFAGRLRTFDVPLRPRGTAFQLEVWEALRAIPYGTTVSYSEIARRIGRPSAARAVGRAVGQNPLGVVVPCHRVVGASGALTGFAWGLDRKRRLLKFEATVAQNGTSAIGAEADDGSGSR